MKLIFGQVYFFKRLPEGSVYSVEIKENWNETEISCFFKKKQRRSEEGMEWRVGTRFHPGNLFRELFLKARSLYKSLCSLAPHRIYWCWRFPLAQPWL